MLAVNSVSDILVFTVTQKNRSPLDSENSLIFNPSMRMTATWESKNSFRLWQVHVTWKCHQHLIWKYPHMCTLLLVGLRSIALAAAVAVSEVACNKELIILTSKFKKISVLNSCQYEHPHLPIFSSSNIQKKERRYNFKERTWKLTWQRCWCTQCIPLHLCRGSGS